MDILWSPWRNEYINTFKNEKKEHKEGTFFLEAANSPEKDKELLVVCRRKNCFVMLNKFPYNNGHLLIAPYRETGDLEDLTTEEITEIMQTVQIAVKALKKAYRPHGFNIGCNMGSVAGAGVPQHIHFHIVPRWNGDSNFMAVLAESKVISESLEKTHQLLSGIFKELIPEG